MLDRIGFVSIFFLSVLCYNPAISQQWRSIEAEEPHTVYVDKTIGFSTGGSYLGIRDFATSPLWYTGLASDFSLSYEASGGRSHTGISAMYTFGPLYNLYNRHGAVSNVQVATVSFSRLQALTKWSSKNRSLFVGGELNTTANYRVNAILRNNGEGFETIANLMASARATWSAGRIRLFREDLSRKGILAIDFGIGLVNATYRNGFTYTGQGALLNNKDYLDGYRVRVFSGWRLKTQLSYTMFLNNTNGIRLGYLWDVYSTGGDDPYEMVRHQGQFSFLYSIR